MKKKLLLLLLFPIFINAKECDKAKHQEYVPIAQNISYENDFVKSTKKFEITIYNVFDGLYINYDGKNYSPNSQNEVVISNIAEGKYVVLNIFANDGCEALKAISIIEPYYNEFYEKSICNGYKDKIPQCSLQFTSSKVTESNVRKAIKNFDNPVDNTPQPDTENEELTMLDKIKVFVKEWGIKIGLSVVTILVSSTIYNNKFSF